MNNENQVFDWFYHETSSLRLDKFLSQEMADCSRTQIQEWIKAGNAKVNNEQVKANYKLQKDDHIIVTVPAPKEADIDAEPMDLDILFEDEDVIVVNKPRGLVVHPAPGHYSGTLVNGLMAHCQDLSGINGMMRPGIVHRIDKDTSGLLMVAKNDQAHISLAEQLQEHSVTRRYIAIVHGQIPHEKGTIDAPIGRDPKHRQQMAVVKNGKPAITHFRIIETFNKFSLVELQLETGRTHQIRVHMKYIGYPLAGDPKYGPAKTLGINGQALHAKILGFHHPHTKEALMFEAPLPEDMELELKRLRMQ